MKRPIYLDSHATTRLDPRVLEAMLPYFGERFGNAGSSSHRHGLEAAAAVDHARAEVGALVGAEPEEIAFTSGATEANTLAIAGLLQRRESGARHVVTAVTEHPSVLETCRALERRGARLTVLPVDARGMVTPDQVVAALADDTVLVSVMAANNEIGTLQPVAEIGSALAGRGVALHCDAAQAAGRIPLRVRELGVDLLSISAHKLHGPKGVGALFVRRGARHARPSPLGRGGGQEGGLRPGTLNVPGIVGFGRAAALAASGMEDDARRVRALRDSLQAALVGSGLAVSVNGHPELRLPGNLSVTFEDVDAEELLLALQGEVSAAAGAACASGSTAPSHVLLAIGLSPQLAKRTIRFGLDRDLAEDDVRRAAEAVIAAARRLAGPPRRRPR